MKISFQKMMDHSGIYACEEDLLFVAEQKCEILAVERQIEVSMRRGKIVNTNDGNRMIKSSDAFSIFKNIPGTPSYWRGFRNEILARMEQLGPFHMFFTLSCAETKWDHVLASVLQKEGHEVTLVKENARDKGSKRKDQNTARMRKDLNKRKEAERSGCLKSHQRSPERT